MLPRLGLDVTKIVQKLATWPAIEKKIFEKKILFNY